MTLVDQVLHQDCIPVLEFEIVSIFSCPFELEDFLFSLSLSLSLPLPSTLHTQQFDTSETWNGDSI